MEMQMEYFFWTAMPWVCLEITVIQYNALLYVPSITKPVNITFCGFV